ncbi:hypothetical protein EUGRSUZ_A01750 [Eucalyptus grandis]|uniref:Uncharacterized protein n=2 Tax=Eucalyptus grandis TaxID=71139 RepID=A0ACC3M466_EUCGR|nr:hypothetical protein EUGRSUZ_A01750 [Eucalyptus grandis]
MMRNIVRRDRSPRNRKEIQNNVGDDDKRVGLYMFRTCQERNAETFPREEKKSHPKSLFVLLSWNLSPSKVPS